MKQVVAKGKTSLSVFVFIRDSSASTGVGLTGLAYNSGSLVGSYARPGAARTAITLATQTVTGAYSSGGFVEVDATNMPGIYRLDVPDAVVASGVDSAIVMLKGATNMEPVAIEFQLTGFDLQQTIAQVVTSIWGNALTMSLAAGSAGQRLAAITGMDWTATAQAGGANTITLAAGATSSNVFDPGNAFIIAGTGAGQMRAVLDYNTTTKVATVDRAWKVNPDNTSVYMMLPQGETLHSNEGIAAGGAAATITLNATASATNSVYVGQIVALVGGTGADQTGMITGYVGATKVATVTPAWATVPDTTTVYKVLPTGLSYGAGGTVASVSGAVGSIATGGISTASFAAGAINAAAIATDAIGAAELATDSVTEIVTAVWANATRTLSANTNLNDLSAAGIRAAVGMASANLDTQLTAIDDFIDTEVAAIKAKTDQLTFTVTNQVDVNVLTMGSNVMTAASAAADLTTELQSGLATSAALATLAGYVDTEVAAIKAVTDKLDNTVESTSDGYVFTVNALANGPSGGGGGGGPTAVEIADEVETRTIAGVTLVLGLAANSVTSSALAADAVTEIKDGLASANVLEIVAANVDQITADVGELPTNAELATALASADDAVLARLGTPAGASLSADIIAIKADTAAVLLDTGTDGVVVATGSKTGFALSGAGVDAVWDEVVDGATTGRESMRLQNAVLGGKASGMGSVLVTFRDLADTKDRVVATVDADESGNRTAVTLDLTP